MAEMMDFWEPLQGKDKTKTEQATITFTRPDNDKMFLLFVFIDSRLHVFNTTPPTE